eukprot:3446536-Rhodomonas_salina.1
MVSRHSNPVLKIHDEILSRWARSLMQTRHRHCRLSTMTKEEWGITYRFVITVVIDEFIRSNMVLPVILSSFDIALKVFDKCFVLSLNESI